MCEGVEEGKEEGSLFKLISSHLLSGRSRNLTTYQDELSKGQDGWADPYHGIDDGTEPAETGT